VHVARADASDEIEPPEGNGLDQGAAARVREALASVAPAEAPADRNGGATRPQPLLGPPQAPPTRIYVAVGIAKRGRKGPPSRRVAVPLVAPPPPPSAPTIDYTETEITVAWAPPLVAGPQQAPAGALLPAPVAAAAVALGGERGLALLVVGSGGFWLYEHRAVGALLPPAYLALRRHLTLAVCILLALIMFASDAAGLT